MSSDGMSRRTMFGAGSAVLAGTAVLAESGSARASTGGANEAVVRAWYKNQVEAKNWEKASALTTDDFTFTSPNDDDHISKAEFKKRCWDTQIPLIKAVDLDLVMAQGDDVLVKYTGHTMNGKTFENVEQFRLRDHRIASLRCFFGGTKTFPSSVSAR
jgi:predicted SnoaL-like aldol condensation-catalyzing enzyme